MATEELALLATYKADEKVKVETSKSFAANVKVNEDDDKKEESPKEKARRRSLEFCGKCSICSKNHTWLRKDGENWPSDRFIS